MGQVIFLRHVGEADHAAVITRDRESHGVGARIGWKTWALLSGIAKIAQVPQHDVRRLKRLAWVRVANAAMRVAQRMPSRRIHKIVRGRMKERARHPRYSSTETFIPRCPSIAWKS